MNFCQGCNFFDIFLTTQLFQSNAMSSARYLSVLNNFVTFFFFLALEEARDINIHLKPLRRLLDDMEQFDFSELDKIIPAILHTVGLIWANSKYYCRAPRMIVLLQELCNMLIEMVSNF